MEILDVVKIPPTKAWRTQMDWVRKAANNWNCGCIFTEEHADAGASRYSVVSADWYPAHCSPKDCKILLHITCSGPRGSRLVYRVCGNGHCSCKNNTPVTCSENMFNQNDFNEGENMYAASVPDTR